MIKSDLMRPDLCQYLVLRFAVSYCVGSNSQHYWPFFVEHIPFMSYLRTKKMSREVLMVDQLNNDKTSKSL